MIPISVENLLSQVIHSLKTYLIQNKITDPALIGIRTGGVWLAERIHETLKLTEPMGILDISFYRDDFSRVGLNPHVKPSNIAFDIENRDIILVDDVLKTGRTIRAALNEIFDYGRPKSVTLICLLELEGRELPIRADIVGQHLTLSDHQHIKLKGPEQMELVINDMSTSNEQ